MAKTKRKKRFFDVEIPLINKTTQLQAYEIKELSNFLTQKEYNDAVESAKEEGLWNLDF